MRYGQTEDNSSTMAIPDYQACMLPLLRFASDGKEHQLKDAAERLAEEFGLTAKELQEFFAERSAAHLHEPPWLGQDLFK